MTRPDVRYRLVDALGRLMVLGRLSESGVCWMLDDTAHEMCRLQSFKLCQCCACSDSVMMRS